MSHHKMTFQRLIAILFSRPRSQREAVRRRRLWIAVIMRLIVLLVLILLLVLIIMGARACSRHRKLKAQQEAAERQAEANAGDCQIGFTGGIVLDDVLTTNCQDDSGVYDLDSMFQYVKANYKQPDIMICEVEGNIEDVEKSVSGAPATLPGTLKDAGVDLQMLATNHIYDAKGDGLKSTLATYKDSGAKYTGIRADTDKKRWTIVKSGSVKIGIADYAYGTPERFNGKEIDPNDAKLINMFKETDPVDFYPEVEKQVKAMKKAGADYIVYMIHWGAEYDLEPSKDQLAIAQQLCNLGVDALIGNHPHVEQPIDVLKSESGSHQMFCIYSIGNALASQRQGDEMDTAHCEDGAILTFDLHKSKKGKVTLTDISLIPTWVSKQKVVEKKKTEDEDKKTDTNTEDETAQTAEEEDEDATYDFAILPLNKIEKLEKKTGIKGVKDDAKASYERTMKILGEGLEKAKRELVK